MAQNSLTSTNKDIIIDLRIEGAKEAAAQVAYAAKEIDDLKKAQKALKDEYKDGTITEKEYYDGLVKIKTQMADQKNTMKANQKILDEQVKAYQKQEGSINSMRAHLKLLRAQYEDLSKTERDSAKGDELLKKIKAESDAIKQLEANQGDFRSNVGNYMSIWEDQAAGFTSLGDVMSKVFGSNSIFAKLAGVMKTAGNSIGYLAREVKNTSDATTQANNTIIDSAKTMSSSVSHSYTEVGQSMTSVGDAAEGEAKVVQGFGKALYDTTDGTKAAAAATTETTKAVEGMGAAATTTAAAETAAGTAATGMAGGFKTAAVAVKGLAKQMLSLLANPYVAAFTAIVVVVMKLVDAFKKSDSAMTALQTVFAAFRPVIDVVNKAFTALANIVGKVADGIGKFVHGIMSMIPGLKDYADAERDAVLATDALEDTEREYTINSAKRQSEIAKLREQAADREKYSFEQRKEFMQQALDLEKAELEEKKAIAEERYRIAEKQALLDIGYTEMSAEAWETLSDEVKDSLTDLKAAAIQAETDYSNSARTFVKQMSTFTKQEESENKQRAANAANAAKERKKNEKQALRDLEDMTINAIKNLQVKETQQMKVQTQRQIDDIKERLKTEKNLTTAAKRALNEQIVLLEADLQIKLGELQKRYASDETTKRLQEQINYYKNMLSAVPEGDAKISLNLEINTLETDALLNDAKNVLDSVKTYYTGVINELNTDIEKMSEDQLLEKYGTELLLKGISSGQRVIDQVKELREKYNDEIEKQEYEYANNVLNITRASELAKTRIQKEAMNAREALALKHQELMSQIETNTGLDNYYYNELEKTKILEEQAQKRLEITKSQYENIKNYSQEEISAVYGTQEAYDNAVAESFIAVQNAELGLKDATNQVIAAQQAQKDAMMANATAIMGSFNSIASSFQTLFEQMAEGDEKYSKYATAMAMMQILVSTAISIANAIQGATAAAAATGPGAPIATPIFIAEMVGIVAGALVSATTTLMKAKAQAPSAPQFSSGGLVGSKTTSRTDDTVDAKLSLGEYVIQSRIVKKYGIEFFNQLNETKTNKKLGLPLKFSTGGSVPSVQNIQSITAQIDYSQMKDIFTEVVQEIQPVVSVKEITTKQNRVKVKENISSYK